MSWMGLLLFVIGAAFGAGVCWALVWATDAVETMFKDWEDHDG